MESLYRGLTDAEIAKRMNRNEEQVTGIMRLLALRKELVYYLGLKINDKKPSDINPNQVRLQESL
ncbi:MAG: hypothetical protein GF384_04975 [Elusimicrobia bacterium]|nr:hypothetical protein [Elusimicrobiota bacterium]MBD3412148.1 hypothetical protein [Elusimicrobiota bacterium]